MRDYNMDPREQGYQRIQTEFDRLHGEDPHFVQYTEYPVYPPRQNYYQYRKTSLLRKLFFIGLICSVVIFGSLIAVFVTVFQQSQQPQHVISTTTHTEAVDNTVCGYTRDSSGNKVPLYWHITYTQDFSAQHNEYKNADCLPKTQPWP